MKLLKPGAKFRSAVCDTQLMVIRTVPEPIDLRCGGAAMLEANATALEAVTLDPAFAEGTLMGKRYIDAADRIELLCTKAGRGSISLGAEPLAVKQAKALPSSD